MNTCSIESQANPGIKSWKLQQSSNVKDKDLDDILNIVGAQAKYQKIFLYLILGSITAMEPLLGINLLFMLYEPNHWCLVPGREQSGFDPESWKNLTIPRDDNGEFSKCEMFDQNRTKVACAYGWEYDLKDYDHTIPLDYNWVCEKSQWATWVLFGNAVGNAIGTICLGQAADKIGRKPVFIITLVLIIFGRIASLHVVGTYWAFLLLAVITGLGFPMIYIAPAMIGAEISSKEFRAWIYSWSWIIWVVGMATLPWIAYFTRDWYTIGLVTTIPCILAFIICKWIPESPRWLMSMGKIEKVAEIVKEIARVNGTHAKLSDKELMSMLEQVVAKQAQSDQNLSVIKLFSTGRIAINTILVTLSWTMNAVIYYAITLNASNLSGNQFLNFFILAIIEAPAGYFGSILCDKIGRRWTQVLFFIVCAASSIVAGVAASFPAVHAWNVISVVAAVVAKFVVTLTFLVIYLQAAKVFPTLLRSTGSGFASANASVVNICTPFIVYSVRSITIFVSRLSFIWVRHGWFTIAAASVVGIILCVFARNVEPEFTRNVGRSSKFWERKQILEFSPCD